MKKISYFFILVIITILFSCETTDSEIEVVSDLSTTEPVVETSVEPVSVPEPEVAEEEIIVVPESEEEIIPEVLIEPEIIPEPEPEPVEVIEEIVEEPEIIEEIFPEPEPIFLESEPEVIIIEDIPEEVKEYSRSVSTLEDGSSITEETFNNDKHEILDTIQKLDIIMKNKNYNQWLNYLTESSKTFWSDRKNLSELSQKLFSKYNFELKNLRDYFEYFFIPARKGRVVDEIRYVTANEVKAVQYKDDEDIIYYFLEKQDDRWFLNLDTHF